jgi:hypothetical protein
MMEGTPGADVVGVLSVIYHFCTFMYYIGCLLIKAGDIFWGFYCISLDEFKSAAIFNCHLILRQLDNSWILSLYF